ncbi:MAG: hypothetical protein KTR17_11225 [Cellvibrionaceae bacterium]|nr:hypothetical protein [Cellvibrionaceae bacterium]
MKFFLHLVLLVFFSQSAVFAQSPPDSGNVKSKSIFKITYDVGFSVADSSVLVKIFISNSALIRSLDFNLRDHKLEKIKASGEWVEKDQRLVWTPPETGTAWLKYKIKLVNQRENGAYDAKVGEDWALFRGDDIVPPVKSRFTAGATSKSKIRFNLPKGWHSVNTGWPRLTSEKSKRNAEFKIVKRETRFDRPVGWIIAGDIGTRRELIGDTWVSVSAPVGEDFRRMDMLTLLHFVWPEMQKSFRKLPSKVLLVGAGNPFWRGGLSAPNSLFLHTERPMVSENGTSTLLHEFVHVITGIRGQKSHDWIAEGLAEFYSVELLYRAGGISESRRKRVLAELDEWSENVTRLDVDYSTGPVTAKAALFFFALDDELKSVSGGKMNIDDLTRQLRNQDKVSAEDIRKTFVLLTGKKSAVYRKWRKWFAGASSSKE